MFFFQVKRLYKLFIAVDCLQLEVNPLALTPEGLIYTADAKLVTAIQVWIKNLSDLHIRL